MPELGNELDYALNDLEFDNVPLKIILPSDREECDEEDFYMLHNGGTPKEYIYNNGNRVLIINQFLPFRYGIYRDMTIEEVYNSLLEDEEISNGYVPFAMEESGDYVIISLTEKDYECIYLWSHEYAGIKKISDSFESFIECLTDKIPHESK